MLRNKPFSSLVLLPFYLGILLSDAFTVREIGCSRRNKYPILLAVKISTPSPDEAASMGIREWPQQVKSNIWSESGSDLTRYVLDGKGYLTYDKETRIEVGPGSLVEVDSEPSQLVWEITSNEMIILTPGYEEGGKLLAVAATLVVLAGALIFGLGA